MTPHETLKKYGHYTCPERPTPIQRRVKEKETKMTEEQDEKELLLRKLLWLNHGCTLLYGDDGEMQCGQCLIDFKRDRPKLIERKFMLRHGKFTQTKHGEIFIPNETIMKAIKEKTKELEGIMDHEA